MTGGAQAQGLLVSVHETAPGLSHKTPCLQECQLYGAK